MDTQDEIKTSENMADFPEATAASLQIEGPLSLSELDVLKARARMLGVNFSNNIGVDALRQRINDKMAGAPEEADRETNALGDDAEAAEPVVKKTAEQILREQIMSEQMKLVRLRITCMDPKKADLHGEIFTIANEYLGTVRKFIPFGEVTEDGFHVPFCLYTMLKEKEFLNIKTTKDPRTGLVSVRSNYAKEFALEVLPQLTQAELDTLANAQRAAGSVDGPLRN